VTPPKPLDLDIAPGDDDMELELAKAAIYLAFCPDTVDLPGSLRSNIEQVAQNHLGKKGE
jgi:hypothetical protein